MSLVHLANACSHLQNASRARLGFTSVPRTNQLQKLFLAMQNSGYINSVTIGGPDPPPASSLSPIISVNPASRDDLSTHVALTQHQRREHANAVADGNYSETSLPESVRQVTQANVASRRLWIVLKYFNNRPMVETMRMISRPTRRITMGVSELEEIVRGRKQGYVKGMDSIGEAIYLSTDRGIIEIREAIERRTGGVLLCRINAL